jgi:hypothetical protein
MTKSWMSYWMIPKMRMNYCYWILNYWNLMSLMIPNWKKRTSWMIPMNWMNYWNYFLNCYWKN